jgi:hypothetical protein
MCVHLSVAKPLNPSPTRPWCVSLVYECLCVCVCTHIRTRARTQTGIRTHKRSARTRSCKSAIYLVFQSLSAQLEKNWPIVFGRKMFGKDLERPSSKMLKTYSNPLLIN